MSVRPLLAWLDAPSTRRGIRFAQLGESWDFWTYARLAQFARRIAWGLVRTGVREDDVVNIILRSEPAFVATFFGTMLAGATPSPVAPSITFQNVETYQEHVTGVLRVARPSVVVTDAASVGAIRHLASAAGLPVILTVEDLLYNIKEADVSPERNPAEMALLQFTSGSSGRSRGVRVPFDALEKNVGAIRRWLQWTNEDPFACWLPLHHDMGLIGGLICSAVSRSDLWLLQPEQFIRSPLRYLRCFGRFSSTLSVTASFSLDFICRRVKPEALTGLDFSGWRGVVVGAERIEARSLDDFYKLLSPFGFRRRALLPAYGLAEATLAVTGLPLEEEWTGLSLEPSSLSLGREVEISGKGKKGPVVVGCGRPLDGVSVVIVDERGQPVPDGRVGEIVANGSSVAAGYITDAESPSSTVFSGQRLRTGDAGFLLGGQLFVLGRLGDSMKVRGRVVFGEDLEAALNHLGFSRQRVVALLGFLEGVPTAVIVGEKLKHWPAEAEALLHYHTGGARVVLVNAPKGTIARTSSGKPKRRQLWRAFVNGTLAGQVITNLQ
jgi:acyl-CoA synthetase (AMP-forming)/AMP-acid ligase II